MKILIAAHTFRSACEFANQRKIVDWRFVRDVRDLMGWRGVKIHIVGRLPIDVHQRILERIAIGDLTQQF